MAYVGVLIDTPTSPHRRASMPLGVMSGEANIEGGLAGSQRPIGLGHLGFLGLNVQSMYFFVPSAGSKSGVRQTRLKHKKDSLPQPQGTMILKPFSRWLE